MSQVVKANIFHFCKLKITIWDKNSRKSHMRSDSPERPEGRSMCENNKKAETRKDQCE